MIDTETFRAIALSFEDVEEVPHMDRAAFRVKRNFATLAPDGLTTNVRLTPEEQEFKCMMAPECLAPVSGGWGRMGWTTINLSAIDEAGLQAVLEMAHRHALPRPKSGRKGQI